MKAKHISRRARLTAIAVSGGMAATVALAAGSAALAASASPAGCQPGSGRNLTGTQFTNASIQSKTFTDPGYFRCANLTGDNLSGLTLDQKDFTGALLRNANLSGASMIQVTLTGAVLTGANLTGAQMGQVTAQGADFAGANLSHADLTQAEIQNANFTSANLTGAGLGQATATNANFAKATLSGTDFTQAELGGANFKGAKGILPYAEYLGIFTAVILVWMLARSFSGRRGGRRAARQSSSNATVVRKQAGLARRLIGAVMIALGLQAFIGGLLGSILSATGPPIAQVCTPGPLCTVGVNSGFAGIFAGMLVLLLGFGIRLGGRSRSVSGTSGMFNQMAGLNQAGGFQGGFIQPGNFNQPGQPGGFNQPGGYNQAGGFNQGGFGNQPGGFGSQGGGFN